VRVAAAALLFIALAASSARADADPTQKLFGTAVTALQRGAFDEAIAALELLADQGVLHPDASFNRAVAYIDRARSPQARPGDLGRAAAALAETVELRPDDAEAEAALESVRAEIARRRARHGEAPVVVRPSLSRAVVALLSEDAWAVGALLGSVLFAAGLAVRWLSRTAPVRLGGAVAAAAGALFLLISGSMTIAARTYRKTSDPAVVIVSEARLLDEKGVPLPQKGGVPEQVVVPEGAGVHVLERRGTLALIEWGDTRGWIGLAQLRVLPEI
jgi:hypothetical protein